MRHREKERKKNRGSEGGVGKKEEKREKGIETGATEDKELQRVHSVFSNW